MRAAGEPRHTGTALLPARTRASLEVRTTATATATARPRTHAQFRVHGPGGKDRMNTYTPDDVERIQELVGALRGSQLHELDGYLRENREGVLRVAQDVARSTSLSCPPAACIARL